MSIAPELPGCYIWKNSNGQNLYIGKAINLRKRSSSYFLNYSRLDPKIKKLVDVIADVEYLTVDNEVEAFILESNLIKKYKPKYNKLMKDDKNYSFVKIDWYNNYPGIQIVREKKDKKAEYYGPYPSKFPVIKVIKRLRKIFPFCNHLPKTINAKEIKFDIKPCFDYHIDLCVGVCANKISKTEHRKNINGVRQFFKGKKINAIEKLKKDMLIQSKRKEFEKAASLRDRVTDLEYITQRIKIDRSIDDESLVKHKKDLRARALIDLISSINKDEQKINKNFKIECYDISNIQGTNATGSMVVFVDGKSEKSLYRKFKIRSKETPDDFFMMQEVLTRRLKRLQMAQKKSSDKKVKVDKSFSIKPDLIIVDGGKGQLSSAYKILLEFGLEDEIDIVGLAKREEEIFRIREIENGEFEFDLYRIKRRSEALYLVQRIRDEAHRFAVGYHRKLRSFGQTRSALDDIPGVGKMTKLRLIEAFGSVAKIKKATQEDLESVVRNKNTVERIMKVLK